MSGDDSFLTRLSRRKRNVAVRSDAEKKPPPNAAESAKPVSATTGEVPPAIPLPPIESIGSASDIRAFLAPGVPPELTRAALRRAWTADTAIRDFIGLSENAWDFTAPGGVPGFGSLDLQQVRRLVEQVLGEPQIADPGHAPLADHSEALAEAGPVVFTTEPAGSNAATQDGDDEKKTRDALRHRHHGGALPH